MWLDSYKSLAKGREEDRNPEISAKPGESQCGGAGEVVAACYDDRDWAASQPEANV